MDRMRRRRRLDFVKPRRCIHNSIDPGEAACRINSTDGLAFPSALSAADTEAVRIFYPYEMS